MYNDQLVYKAVIWAFFEISLCTEKVALILHVLIACLSLTNSISSYSLTYASTCKHLYIVI